MSNTDSIDINITETSEEHIKDFNELDLTVFSDKQLSQIKIGVERNLDFKLYAKEIFNHAQMFEIRIALQSNISKENLEILCNPEWDNEQMREIRLGIVHAIDFSLYTIHTLSATQMRLIRIDLEHEVYE